MRAAMAILAVLMSYGQANACIRAGYDVPDTVNYLLCIIDERDQAIADLQQKTDDLEKEIAAASKERGENLVMLWNRDVDSYKSAKDLTDRIDALEKRVILLEKATTP